MKGALVLRPEPGNAETAALLAAAGVDVLRQPLFAVAQVAWTPPDPARFDALLLTSANAVRHAGEELSALRGLPVLAVGEATAAAARTVGLSVAQTGRRDAATLVKEAGFARLVHLAGRDHVALPGIEAITVYDSAALPLAPGAARAWEERVALLHSPRAARRFAALIGRDGARRAAIAVAAISPAVADAAGPGWAHTVVADRPRDDALVTRALTLVAGRRISGRDE